MMKIFRLVRKDLAFFGINATQSRSHRNGPFNAQNQIAMSIFCILLFSNCVHITYVSSFEEYINCIYIVTALAGTVLCFATLISESAKWFAFIENVENIFNKKLRNPPSVIACTYANRQAEIWTGIIQLMVAKIAPQFTMLPKFILSIFVYLTTVDSSSLTLPLPMWFPFDVENLIGYLIACLLEYIMISYVFYFIACIISLAIGSFVMLMGLIDDLNDNLKTINEKLKSNETDFQIACQLYSFVQFHSEAKQLVQDFSAIFQPILMLHFLWNIAALCITLLILQIAISQNTSNSVALVSVVFNLFWTLALVFVPCEIGERVRSEFMKLNFTIGQCDWHLLSHQIQKDLPMIVQNAQQPVLIEWFGSISCSREVFKKVTNRVYSYFMVLREFIL